MTSIVVPVCGGLSDLRRCLQSVRRHTALPHELIVVDNGSPAGVRRYLAGLPGARVLRNARNLGFARAVNQGMRAARGRRLLWLNSDAVVTPGWLEGLLGHLDADPGLGAVAPMTDGTVVPAQRLRPSPEALGDLPRFAAAWSLGRRGRRTLVPWVNGFCFLLHRRALEKVGWLDEGFGKGPMEDRDYCLRLRLAGFRIAVAGDVFVRHLCNRTFHRLFRKEDVRRWTEQAARRFLRKWERGGAPVRDMLSVLTPAP